jgi:prepilin-type N-terminal cleavage/methylation domain-containing protein
MSKKDRDVTKNMKRIIRRNDGFTLLEVIMAVSILTIGLLAVASMQVSAMRGNSMSMEYSESTEQVQDRVEKLLGINLASLIDTDGDGAAGLSNTGAGADYNPATTDPKYTIYYNVAENWAGGKAVSKVNTIRVIAVWQDRGKTRTYSFDLLRNRI